MPKFTINCMVHNNGTATVSAHVGASLVYRNSGAEYFNKADDIKKDFPVGVTHVVRYLNTELGPIGKYDLYIALWEGEKNIGQGIKYSNKMIPEAVEKKKKKVVKMEITTSNIVPTSFIEM